MKNKNFYLFKDYKKFLKNKENTLFIKKAEEIEREVKTKETEIFLFDKTYEKRKKNKEIIIINNHINKSGNNPLLANKQEKICFYDITQIYKHKKEGVTTTCLGKRYQKEKKEHPYPSENIVYIAIELYIKGYKNINARLVNFLG